MALKLFFTLLFVILSFFSLPAAHGRENFSKFTHVVNSQINEKTNNNNNNNVKETTVVPNKEDPLTKQNQEEDQDPLFIHETQNAYGLYGRGNVPTEKTTTYTENSNDNSGGNYYYNNNNEYENGGVPEDMITDTSLMGSGYTTPMSSRGYRNGYDTDKQGNRGQYKYNGETMYSSEEEPDNSYQYDKRYSSNNPYNSGNRYNSNQYDAENKYGYNYDQEYYNSVKNNDQQQNYNGVNKYSNEQHNYYNGANKYSNEQQNYNGANKYSSEQQNYYNGANKYSNEQQNYYNGANKYSNNGANKYNNNAQQNYYNGANKYNVEKQGMSDTRFLENGRYFYDTDNEKNNYRRDYYNTEQYGLNNENAYEFDRSGDEYKNQNQYP